MTIKTYRRHGLALVAAGLLLPALAGCSRSEPEEQPAAMTENDAGVIETQPEDVMPAMENQAAPVADMNAVEETLPPPPPLPADFSENPVSPETVLQKGSSEPTCL